jgi:MFS family permease
LALALLSVVQFMIVLDIAIVNVALPSIQVDLDFSQENLQWVISAYALVFGGFLLLGGRAADLVGRRRLFIGGLAVFTAASLVAALAWNEPSLIGARALQGLGAAVIAPAALSILMTTFSEGKERNIALGVWGAVGGFGAAAGVLLGESRDTRAASFDALGAVLVTAGLSTAVFGITQANDYGWASGKTIGIFSAAIVLLAGFVVRETRAKDPLMSFSIFRIKTVAGANAAGFILSTATMAMFLMLTLYMQQVLGFSPMQTGVAYLAVAVSVIVWSAVASALVTRGGVKPVLVTGMAIVTVGLLYFTQVSADGSYVGDLLPGFLVIALGMGFSFVPVSIAALAGVEAKDAGLASGLINTSQQIGSALGIAVLSAIAVAHSSDATRAGERPAEALVTVFHAAFWAGAAVAAAGVVASLLLVRRDELERPSPDLVPIPA